MEKRKRSQNEEKKVEAFYYIIAAYRDWVNYNCSCFADSATVR